MAITPKVLVKQTDVEQLHDNIDWVTTKLAECERLVKLSGDELVLDLLQDIHADVDHLKGSLPPRQLKFDF